MKVAIIGAGASGLMLGNILNEYHIPFTDNKITVDKSGLSEAIM